MEGTDPRVGTCVLCSPAQSHTPAYCSSFSPLGGLWLLQRLPMLPVSTRLHAVPTLPTT